MSRKNPSAAILEALKSLKEETFREFCHRLTSSEEEPPFFASEVDNKTRVEVMEVLVSRCSSGAVDRTIRTLKDIGCTREAERLAANVEEEPRPKRERSKSPPPRCSSTAGASSAEPTKQEHFVDRHQIALTNRVSNIEPILDILLKKKVLKPEQYNEVREIRPKEKQMRFLFAGPLTAGGNRSKDVLLEALKAQESYLIQDLRENEG